MRVLVHTALVEKEVARTIPSAKTRIISAR